MGFTVIMKTLNLRFAVTSGRLDHANVLSVLVTQKGIRVFDAMPSLWQAVLTDPHRGQLRSLQPIGRVDRRQSQVMIPVIPMRQTAGGATH